MKSKKTASFVFSTAESSLELGLRFFPLLLVIFLGFPLESAQIIPHRFTRVITISEEF